MSPQVIIAAVVIVVVVAGASDLTLDVGRVVLFVAVVDGDRCNAHSGVALAQGLEAAGGLAVRAVAGHELVVGRGKERI